MGETAFRPASVPARFRAGAITGSLRTSWARLWTTWIGWRAQYTRRSLSDAGSFGNMIRASLRSRWSSFSVRVGQV